MKRITVHTSAEFEVISGQTMEFSLFIPRLNTAFADRYASMPYDSLPAQNAAKTAFLCMIEHAEKLSVGVFCIAE